MAAPVPAAAPLAAAEDAASALEEAEASLEAEAEAEALEALEAAELLDPDEQPARAAAMAVAAPTPMKLLLVKSFMFIPSLNPNLTGDAPISSPCALAISPFMRNTCIKLYLLLQFAKVKVIEKLVIETRGSCIAW